MTASLTRISPAAKPIPTRFHFLCERCDAPIDSQGIAIACSDCTLAAWEAWPDLPVVLGQMSGT